METIWKPYGNHEETMKKPWRHYGTYPKYSK
jgi:hypothetical protein